MTTTSFADMLASMQEQNERMSKLFSYPAWLSSVNTIAASCHQHHNQLVRAMNPFKEILERHDATAKIFSKSMLSECGLGATKFQSAADILVRDAQRWRSSLDVFTSKIVVDHQQLLKTIEPLGGVHSALESIAKSFQAQQNLLIKSLAPYDWTSFIQPIANESQSFEHGIAIQPDGTVSVADTTLSVEEVAAAVEDFSDQLQHDWNGTIQWIADYIRKAPVALRWLLLIIVWPFLQDIAHNYAYDYLKTIQLPLNSSAVSQKQISNVMVKEFTEEALREFRFVTAPNLNVRDEATTKSRVVGLLHAGDVVRIVAWGRSWSLVEYRDHMTGDMYTGWVFSRYLERFKSRIGAHRRRKNSMRKGETQ